MIATTETKVFTGQSFFISGDPDFQKFMETMIKDNGGAVVHPLTFPRFTDYLVYPANQIELTVGKQMTCVSDQQILDAICGGEPIPPLDPPPVIPTAGLFGPGFSFLSQHTLDGSGSGGLFLNSSSAPEAVKEGNKKKSDSSSSAPPRGKKSKTKATIAELKGDLEPSKAFKPSNQAFRSDRATVHLYQAETNDEDEGDGEEESSISPADLARLRPFLRRGDILENTSVSGYRSEGVSMYDGRRVVSLSYDEDDYGCLGPDYVLFREFNPCYFDYATMNVNNLLVPDMTEAQSCWHSGNYPVCYIDRTPIVDSQGLQVTLFGKVYNIPQEFKDWVMENAEVEGPVDHEDMIFVEGMEEGVSVLLL